MEAAREALGERRGTDEGNVGSRAEPERAAERELGRTIAELTAEVSHIAVNDERFEDLVDLTVHMLRGMALQRILQEDDSKRRRHFELWKRIVRQTIEGLESDSG